MSMEMACPWRKGVSGTSSCSGDHLPFLAWLTGLEAEYSLRVAVCDNSVQANLMQIWRLKFQHFMDALLVNLVRSIKDFNRSTISASEARFNELLAICIEEIECVQMRACRDLNELRKAVPNLRCWERAKKGEVKERMHRSMVRSQAVFVVAVVDCNFDRHRGVNQTDDGRRNPNEVGVSAICSASEPALITIG